MTPKWNSTFQTVNISNATRSWEGLGSELETQWDMRGPPLLSAPLTPSFVSPSGSARSLLSAVAAVPTSPATDAQVSHRSQSHTCSSIWCLTPQNPTPTHLPDKAIWTSHKPFKLNTSQTKPSVLTRCSHSVIGTPTHPVDPVTYAKNLGVTPDSSCILTPTFTSHQDLFILPPN